MLQMEEGILQKEPFQQIQVEFYWNRSVYVILFIRLSSSYVAIN